VSDITYLRTVGGWVYLTVVLDPYDWKVIGWALSADMETVHTTIPALNMAFSNRTPRKGLIFHSDRGVQYCAKSFRDYLGVHRSVEHEMRRGIVGIMPVRKHSPFMGNLLPYLPGGKG
jgi:transposase InsO family protein